MNLPTTDDLIETFDLLSDWEARYAYLIDLGRTLPEMDESIKTDAVLVPGCTSRVWVVAEKKTREQCHSSAGQDNTLVFHFHIDSDATIVKGLCAVVMVFVQDKAANQIQAVDMDSVFKKLNLAGNLSPNRRNGFFAMVERIKQLTR